MFERFTDRARSVLVLAQEEARQLQHGYIGTEHILLGLVGQGDGVGAEILMSFGITLDAVRNEVQGMLGEPQGPDNQTETPAPPFTPRAKKVLELSLREALQLGHSYIGTEHILLGIIREGEGMAAQVLTGLGVSLAAARQRVIEHISSRQGEGQGQAQRQRQGQGRGQGRTGYPRAESDRSQPARVELERASAEPLCPHCRAEVSERALYRTILVKPDASTEGESPLRTYVLYCGTCGVSLHMFTPDADM